MVHNNGPIVNHLKIYISYLHWKMSLHHALIQAVWAETVPWLYVTQGECFHACTSFPEPFEWSNIVSIPPSLYESFVPLGSARSNKVTYSNCIQSILITENDLPGVLEGLFSYVANHSWWRINCIEVMNGSWLAQWVRIDMAQGDTCYKR